MNYTKLSHEKLDLNLINNLVVHESCGAVSFFCGTTRDYFEDKTVVSLKYEAYEEMALKSMNEICEKLREQWPDIENIAIYHRLGTVPVKEASVIIGISSPHRESSLLAIRYAIDELKRMVPIWKLEKYSNPNCQSEWKENQECSWSSKFKNDDRTNINNGDPLKFEECPIADEIPIPKMLIQINANSNELKRRLNCFIQGKRKEIDINNRKDFIEKPQNTNQMIKSEIIQDADEDDDDDNDGDDVDDNEDEDDNKQYRNNFSCARVNSSVFKNINTKSHLKVHRVKNEYGPQTKHDYTETLDKLMNTTTANKMMVNIKQEPLVKSPPKSTQIDSKNGIMERIKNAELYLKLSNNNPLPPMPISKDIYKRLKDIETRILHLETVSPEYINFLPRPYNDNSIRKKKKKNYTIDELDNYIQELQRKNV